MKEELQSTSIQSVASDLELDATNEVIRILESLPYPLTYEEISERANKSAFPHLKTTKGVEEIIHSHKNIFKVEPGVRGLTTSLIYSKKGEKHMQKTQKNTEIACMSQPLNQILYGPPGTGKTYNTIIRSVAIIEGVDPGELGRNEGATKEGYEAIRKRFNQYKSEGRIDFITFHQSYSYEEFVEGIKPDVSDDSKDIHYEITPGIFKKICEKAETPIVTENKLGIPSDASIWKVSLGGTYDNEIRKDCFKNDRIRIGWDSYGENYEDKATEGKRPLDAFYQKMQIGDIVFSCYTNRIIDGIGVIIGEPEFDNTLNEYKRVRKVNWIVKNIKEDIFELNDNTTMTLSTVYKLKISLDKAFNLLNKYNAQTPVAKKNEQKYVLIIDEINRGNISKILGELITLIEDDKREVLSTTLPYSKKPFTVPKNLYILGTMNTSDRSIATIDIALRRRFQFIEMMPREDLINDVEGIDLQTIVRNMNRKISILLDRDHQIGHAYFMGLSSINELKIVWFDKIIPLLNEYFYGDWEKLKLIIPGFIEEQYIPASLREACAEDHFYVFKNRDETDFEALMQSMIDMGE